MEHTLLKNGTFIIARVTVVNEGDCGDLRDTDIRIIDPLLQDNTWSSECAGTRKPARRFSQEKDARNAVLKTPAARCRAGERVAILKVCSQFEQPEDFVPPLKELE